MQIPVARSTPHHNQGTPLPTIRAGGRARLLQYVRPMDWATQRTHLKRVGETCADDLSTTHGPAILAAALIVVFLCLLGMVVQWTADGLQPPPMASAQQ